MKIFATFDMDKSNHQSLLNAIKIIDRNKKKELQMEIIIVTGKFTFIFQS